MVLPQCKEAIQIAKKNYLDSCKEGGKKVKIKVRKETLLYTFNASLQLPPLFTFFHLLFLCFSLEHFFIALFFFFFF